MDTKPHRFVAQVIVAAMDEQGMTASMLADATGIPLGLLRHRLAHRSPFTLAELDLVAQILGTRPSGVLERATVMQDEEHNEGKHL